MATITSPAILIRRVNYGDTDLILTYFTRDEGKVTVIAKLIARIPKKASSHDFSV